MREKTCKFSDFVAVCESFSVKLGGVAHFVAVCESFLCEIGGRGTFSDTSEQSAKVQKEVTYHIAGDF